MKTNDELNILVTGGIPLGLLNKNIGELTEDEEKQIRINVMNANEKLRSVNNEVMRDFARYLKSQGRDIEIYCGLFGVISKVRDTRTSEIWLRSSVIEKYGKLKEAKNEN